MLSAALDHANRIGVPDLPVILALTNRYPSRTQSANYSRTGRWDVGLRLFSSNLEVLTAPDSPFAKLRVMAHLDHIQYDLDEELLNWDMGRFSSIMYDASELPFDRSMEATARFVEAHSTRSSSKAHATRSPRPQGNSATRSSGAGECRRVLPPHRRGHHCCEPRHGAPRVRRNPALSRRHRRGAFADLVGTRMCLHGVSSVPPGQVANLFDDGVCKANIWTLLERDSAPALLRDMVLHAAKVAGATVAGELAAQGVLGPNADLTSASSLAYSTHLYRETNVASGEMKRAIADFLNLWYRRDEA